MILINGFEIPFKKFPNGETHVKIEDFRQAVRTVNKISFKYEEDGDLIKLMFVKKYLSERNLTSSLIVYYMPYSRMDRNIPGSLFTLKYVTDFINSLNFTNVTIIEPHSDVTPALIEKSFSDYITKHLFSLVRYDIKFINEKDYIFFPDAGAQKRYHDLTGYNQLVGYKDRDVQNGKIKSLEVIGKAPNFPQYSKVIIIDDLSSYGNTFVKSAEKLKELGFGEIYLLVAHAENSILHGDLFTSDINKVFCTNSILTESTSHLESINKLKVFKLEEMI